MVLFLFIGNAGWTRSYKVMTSFPNEPFYIQNAESGMVMQISGDDVKLDRKRRGGDNLWKIKSARRDGSCLVQSDKSRRYLSTAVKKKKKKLFKKRKKTTDIVADRSRRDAARVKFLMVSRTDFIIKLPNNLVMDAAGGRKKARRGQDVIGYKNNGGKNQVWRIILADSNRRYDPERKRNRGMMDRPRGDGPDAGLMEAVGSRSEKKLQNYMEKTPYRKFRDENRGHKLSDFLNGMDDGDRLVKIDKIVSGVSRNRSYKMRAEVYRELSMSDITAKSMPAKLLKGRLKKNLESVYSGERNRRAKDALRRLIDKY